MVELIFASYGSSGEGYQKAQAYFGLMIGDAMTPFGGGRLNGISIVSSFVRLKLKGMQSLKLELGKKILGNALFGSISSVSQVKKVAKEIQKGLGEAKEVQ